MLSAISQFGFGNLTQNAGTVITALCPPRKRAYTRLTGLAYTAAGTAHTLSLMKALSYTTLASAVDASGTSVTLSADPGGSSFALAAAVAGAIADNDFVCFELDSGDYFLSIVASLSTLTFTTGAFPSAAAAGRRVWFFGAPGNHTGSQTTSKSITQKGFQILTIASVRNSFSDHASGLLQSNNPWEPLMLHSNNAAAAGIFDQVTGCHTVN